MKNANNLSIQTIEDLYQEIKLVKQRIADTEERLLGKLADVPGEAAKSVLETVLPLFLGKELASGAWKLIQGALQLVSGKSSNINAKDGWRKNILGGAKKIGIFSAFKLLYNLWKSK